MLEIDQFLVFIKILSVSLMEFYQLDN